jgi:hypothetical protein
MTMLQMTMLNTPIMTSLENSLVAINTCLIIVRCTLGNRIPFTTVDTSNSQVPGVLCFL